MKFEPHDYQLTAINHMLKYKRSALFLGMGLGKTVSALSAAWLRMGKGQVKRTLIIAPLRVAKSVWAQEARKWDHLQSLSFSMVLGSEEDRRKALDAEADCYVVNRENVPWLVEALGDEWPYDMVIVDELSSFRTPESKRFAALASRIHRSPYMVGLTGMPAPKGPINLWAQLYLVDGGRRLGDDYFRFRGKWFRGVGPVGKPAYTWVPKQRATEAITAAISDVCLSMAPPPGLLPEALSIVRRVSLPPDAREMYDTFERELVLKLEDGAIEAEDRVPALSKLQQMADGAAYNDAGSYAVIHDEKLDELESLIEEAGGEPLLVFYQFRHDALRIHERFPKSRSVGSPGAIEAWNEGKVPLLLAHPASSGHGLNLQFGGSIIVWFGLTFDLELYEQANARLVRQGQKQIVRIYHIVADGTRDEDVLPVIEGKAISQDQMLRALKRRATDREKERA